jgi:hypothetical protein
MTGSHRRINAVRLTAILTFGVLLVAIVTLAAIVHWWPFEASKPHVSVVHHDGSKAELERQQREEQARTEREQREQKEKEERKRKEHEQQPPKEIWGATVTLEVDRPYTLDQKHITPLYACTGCLMVGDYPDVGLSLQAENGVAEWTAGGRPSYQGCVELLETHSKQAVQLEDSLHEHGLPPKGWLCAKSKSEEVLMLQYLGEEQNGNYWEFKVEAWSKTSS